MRATMIASTAPIGRAAQPTRTRIVASSSAGKTPAATSAAVRDTATGAHIFAHSEAKPTTARNTRSR